jgi:hypothetical protein
MSAKFYVFPGGSESIGGQKRCFRCKKMRKVRLYYCDKHDPIYLCTRCRNEIFGIDQESGDVLDNPKTYINRFESNPRKY